MSDGTLQEEEMKILIISLIQVGIKATTFSAYSPWLGRWITFIELESASLSSVTQYRMPEILIKSGVKCFDLILIMIEV